MNHRLHNDLSKRERQVMDVIYRRKSASAKQVQEDIPNPPTNAAVRSILIILEKKGFIKHTREGKSIVDKKEKGLMGVIKDALLD